MSNDNTKNLSPSWGADLTIICAADFRFLPGVYALFNSAIMNGFAGQFKILINEGTGCPEIATHKQLSTILYKGFAGKFHVFAQRLSAYKKLEPGKYLHLDADMIIERPCGRLFSALDDGLIVSTEPEAKYDPFDVLVYEQCKQTNLSLDLQPFPYVNGGLLGFSLPRDQEFLQHWADLAERHLGNLDHPSTTGNWFFLDQDLLNLLIRQKNAPQVFSISPRQLEFGSFAKLFQNRPFPYTKQGNLEPVDQVKYIIHGAALPRPWLIRQRSGIKGKLITFMEKTGLKAWLRKPSPYERAWAHYACSDNLPIPIDSWASKHGFTSYKNPLWRKFYGLSE